jgi:hypothetical protein
LFASRVPETDHENGSTFPWVSIAVLARMEKVTSILIDSRPCRAHRDSRATCCDHHVGGPPGPRARSRFPRPVHPLHSMHCLTEVRPEFEVLLVELQVLDNLISSGITRPTLGHWQAGQCREALRSVQVETVIVPAPRCRDNVLGFYDLELPTPPAKLSRSRQTSGRSPDYQSLGSSTHRLILAIVISDEGYPPIAGYGHILSGPRSVECLLSRSADPLAAQRSDSR